MRINLPAKTFWWRILGHLNYYQRALVSSFLLCPCPTLFSTNKFHQESGYRSLSVAHGIGFPCPDRWVGLLCHPVPFHRHTAALALVSEVLEVLKVM